MNKHARVLPVVFFLIVLPATAATNNLIRIKVLDSETRTVVLDDSGVPKNCDALNYDAYCHSSKTSQVTNTLRVQEDDGAPFDVACSVDSKWSRCVALPKGENFDARRSKHGITIYYVDDDGKPRKQFFALVAPGAKNNSKIEQRPH